MEPQCHYGFICCVTKKFEEFGYPGGAESRFMTNRMGSFIKTENCPSSESLLAFQLGEVDEITSIERHLGLCEFCLAEVDFYEEFPPEDEEAVEAGPIPEPLRELAEALLREQSDLSPLYKLLTD